MLSAGGLGGGGGGGVTFRNQSWTKVPLPTQASLSQGMQRQKATVVIENKEWYIYTYMYILPNVSEGK